MFFLINYLVKSDILLDLLFKIWYNNAYFGVYHPYIVWSNCMYLLMLLATFMSAIYGYNLSARSDYDRDVARKKAMGVVYRFIYVEDAIKSLVASINTDIYGTASGGVLPSWLLPDDTLYADYTNYDEDTLVLKQGGETSVFYMRRQNKLGQQNKLSDNIDAKNELPIGLHFYDGSMMMSKVICLNGTMWKTATGPCVSPVDETSGAVMESCCVKGDGASNRYLVSYAKLDARWVNRIHKGISLDFWRAIMNRGYADNVGVISWVDEGENSHWKFRGKINFLPVYALEKEEYEEAHKNDIYDLRYYPSRMRDKSVWDLPINVFKHDFFKDKNGQNMCDTGCLFKIRNI